MGKKIYFALALVGIGTLIATGALQRVLDTGGKIVDIIINISNSF